MFIRSLDGFVCPNNFKQKNLMQVYLKGDGRTSSRGGAELIYVHFVGSDQPNMNDNVSILWELFSSVEWVILVCCGQS